MEQLGWRCTTFRESWYMSIFLKKPVYKIQVSLKWDSNKRISHEDHQMCIFDHISLSFSWNEKCFRHNRRETRNTHFVFNNFFFFFPSSDLPPPRKSCLVWDNMDRFGSAIQATDHNIIRPMRIACWIPKATDTHTHTHARSEFIILLLFHGNGGYANACRCSLRSLCCNTVACCVLLTHSKPLCALHCQGNTCCLCLLT
jgi:hypothetical protein